MGFILFQLFINVYSFFVKNQIMDSSVEPKDFRYFFLFIYFSGLIITFLLALKYSRTSLARTPLGP